MSIIEKSWPLENTSASRLGTANFQCGKLCHMDVKTGLMMAEDAVNGCLKIEPEVFGPKNRKMMPPLSCIGQSQTRGNSRFQAWLYDIPPKCKAQETQSLKSPRHLKLLPASFIGTEDAEREIDSWGHQRVELRYNVRGNSTQIMALGQLPLAYLKHDLRSLVPPLVVNIYGENNGSN